MQPSGGNSESIGWYFHLPFCRTKCGYCDFYSLPTLRGLIDPLIRSLRREFDLRDPGRPVHTVFMGGGTPTELPAHALDALLSTVAGRIDGGLEWTVEANPTGASGLKLEMLRRRGVSRVSFGAQSFHPGDLSVLERLHDPRHIVESVRSARSVGFDNVNLDLIYAIPGQSLERWRDSLRCAIDLGVEHLSCYALTYEEGTPLTRLRREGRLVPCSEDLEVEMFELTIDELAGAGFDHYEISNFARPGRQCRANVIYWENREYLGIGPSAVSYLDGVRRKNIPDVRKYVQLLETRPDAIIIEEERLSPRARACETAVQMLRLTRGIDVQRFRERTGFDALHLFGEPIRHFSDMGLLAADDEAVRLTRRGMILANPIMADFLVAITADQAFDVTSPPAAAMSVTDPETMSIPSTRSSHGSLDRSALRRRRAGRVHRGSESTCPHD